MILIPPENNVFNLFFVKIHYYSICIFLAVLVSFIIGYYFAGKFSNDTDKETFSDFVPLLIIFSIIGARLYYVLLSLDYYLINPVSALMVWQGGLSIHGAFLGGLIFGAFYIKKHKLNFFSYADLVCLVLPLGQAIGRWGNFFNKEAFGLPVSDLAPVKLFIVEAFRPEKYRHESFFHPCFLYESILDFCLFIVLLFITYKFKGRFKGLVFYLYIALYSIIRALIEPIRIDTAFFIGKVPFPFLVSIIGIMIGVIGIIFVIKKENKKCSIVNK